MKIKIGTLSTGIATLAVVAAGWFFFAPTQIGGSVSYVQIYGTSMQPRFDAGDLVLVRGASDYRVGQIVAYQNGQLGNHVVLHRIIGSASDRYTFKGDNNNFVDSYHPVRSQLVGRMWLHVPAVGRYLVWLRGSRLFLLIGLGVLLVALTTMVAGGKRHRRRGTRSTGSTASTGSAPVVRTGSLGMLPLAAAALALAFAGLAALSWLHPLTTTAARQGLYTQKGQFGYDAVVPDGQRVYGSTTVTTGQPLFMQIVHSARFHFSYTFASATRHAVAGRVGLDALVSGPNGWKRTLHVAPLQAFTGDHATAAGVLAFKPLLSLLHRIDTLSNVTGGTYTLTLVPRVDVHGIVDGSPLKESFSPRLPLMLDPNQLQLQPGSATGPSAAVALTPSASGSGVVQAPARLALLKLRMPVRLARPVSLFGGIGAVVLLLVSLLFARRIRPAGEHEWIRREYGALIIDVASLPTDSTASTIHTKSFEGIARVAEQSGHVIMHIERAGLHAYAVEDGGVIYLYGSLATDEPAQENEVDLAQWA